jgi:hypothetical protein
MSLCLRSLCVLAFAALGLCTSTTAIADEIARWDFNQEPIGWVPNAETELSLQEGQLKVLPCKRGGSQRDTSNFRFSEVQGHDKSPDFLDD